MKNFIFIFILAGLFSACSTSYYDAGRKNINKFDGAQEAQAEYMLDLNDDFMLLKNLSTEAMKITDSKEVYLSAQFLQEEIEDKYFRITLIAKSNRIALADQLSQDADQKYRQLLGMSKNLFDSAYVSFTMQKLESLHSRLMEYKKTGKDESIVKLSVNLNKMVNEAQQQLPSVEKTIANR